MRLSGLSVESISTENFRKQLIFFYAWFAPQTVKGQHWRELSSKGIMFFVFKFLKCHCGSSYSIILLSLLLNLVV